jgi:tripeptidyl-peptidase-1
LHFYADENSTASFPFALLKNNIRHETVGDFFVQLMRASYSIFYKVSSNELKSFTSVNDSETMNRFKTQNMSLFMYFIIFTFLVILVQHDVTSFELVAGLPHENEALLERRFWQIADPKDELYLQHLSLNEVRDIISPSKATHDAVTTWLKDLGATTTTIGALGDIITAVFDERITFFNNNNNATIPAYPSSLNLDFLLRRDEKVFKSTANIDHQYRHQKNLTALLNGPFYPSAQKNAYGIPADLIATNDTTLQMVWGPGTFGFDLSVLEHLKSSDVPLLNISRVVYDTNNHGEQDHDNFMEGNLDTMMISSFGLNVRTLVSNTNTSASTEEGNGFGQALLDFITQLSTRDELPQVLSLSLGSLGAFSCNLLCEEAAKKGITNADCNDFLQQQRQVCMFLSEKQVDRISAGFKILGARGVSVFASSGDGGSHFSFKPFESSSNIAFVLNEVSCRFNMPVFPTASPYVISVGGTDWGKSLDQLNPKKPEAWPGSGGGFSWQFARPDHQQKVVSDYLNTHKGQNSFPIPNTAFDSLGRAYPDISAVAYDGTSQSCPTTAGMWSLIMDRRLNAGLPPLGFLAPRLWQVNEQFPGEAYESVKTGNTKTSCDTGFPSTEEGWDPVTGWGRPIWAGMAKHFGSDDALVLLRDEVVKIK